ncbi:hypothetical protein KR222_000045 [Zaprionus bogoriensis]|nr:hypothetical protein KR222_000045 [Zaprionus bogoriensis]
MLSEGETVEELFNILLELVDLTLEKSLKSILRFVTDLLNTDNEKNTKLALKLTEKLLPKIELSNPQLLSVLFSFLPSWPKHLPYSGKTLFDRLWPFDLSIEEQCATRQRALQLTYNILIKFEPVIILYPKLYDTLHKLLVSNEIFDRANGKSILYVLMGVNNKQMIIFEEFTQLEFCILMKVMQCMDVPDNNILSDANSPQNKEDKHSSLVMSSFYSSMLQQNNNSLLYWTIVYLMQNTSTIDLKQDGLLLDILNATNKMDLHNLNDDDIPEPVMAQFANSLPIEQFLNALIEVPWIGLPFARWLDSLPTEIPQISHNLFLKFCVHLRNIQNRKIREWANENMLRKFKPNITSLSLREYMNLIETVFQEGDNMNRVIIFHLAEKIQKSDNFNEDIVYCGRLWFRMICDDHDIELYDLGCAVLKQIKNIPESRRGWWRLLPLFTIDSEEVLEFYHKEYGTNMEPFKTYTALEELQTNLKCKTDLEKSFVRRKSVEMFVLTNVHKFTDIEKMQLNVLELLEVGSFYTYQHLATLLESHTNRLQDERVFNTFVELLNKYSHADNSSIESYFDIIINDLQVDNSALYIRHISRLPLNEQNDIFNELLLINKRITEQGPILENSKDHRTQIRIVRLLFDEIYYNLPWNDLYWDALLAPNNCLNISYAYEFIIGTYLLHFNRLVEKLKILPSLQPKQQEALISTAYIFCMHNLDKLKQGQLNEIFDILSQFKTLNLVQWALHNMAKKLREMG